MEAGAERALTPEQESAVARRGQPLLVSAGAGSGKTSVLVERFVRGVCEDGLAPARILAITFTDRAAAELRERVRARLLALHRRDAARDTEAAFVCTFHGFCTRLLRSHPLLAGLDPQFQILDEALAADLRERAFALALRDFFAGERAAAIDLVAAYGADRVRAMLWRTFAELRSRGIRRPRLPDPAARDPDALGAGGGAETGAAASARADGDARRACALLDELLARFGERSRRWRCSRDNRACASGGPSASQRCWSMSFRTQTRASCGSWPRSSATTCSRSATNCSRSMGFATQTYGCFADAVTSSSRAERACG
jgi:hypothetical protein